MDPSDRATWVTLGSGVWVGQSRRARGGVGRGWRGWSLSGRPPPKPRHYFVTASVASAATMDHWTGIGAGLLQTIGTAPWPMKAALCRWGGGWTRHGDEDRQGRIRRGYRGYRDGDTEIQMEMEMQMQIEMQMEMGKDRTGLEMRWEGPISETGSRLGENRKQTRGRTGWGRARF